MRSSHPPAMRGCYFLVVGRKPVAVEGTAREAAAVDLGSAAREWQTHGFVILPGFVPAAELRPR